MQFNKDWKYFLLEARDPEFLLEIKIKDVKAKYPDLESTGWINWGRRQLEYALGPKSVSKYLMWYARELHHNFDGESETISDHDQNDVLSVAEELIDMLVLFEQNLHKMVQKDIYGYNGAQLQQLLDKTGLTAASQAAAEKSAKAKAEQDSEVVYDSHGIIAIRPLTEQASCYYGENPRLTNWCISGTEKRNYFKQYTEEEGKAFIIVRFFGIPEENDRHIIALEMDHEGDLSLWWDAPNEAQNPDDLEEVIALHLKSYEETKNFSRLRMDLRVERILGELLGSAKKTILANPPPPRHEAAEKACEEIKQETESDLENIETWYEVDEDRTYMMTERARVDFGAIMQLDIDTRDPSYTEAENNLEKIDSATIRMLSGVIGARMYDRGYGSAYEDFQLQVDEYGDVAIIFNIGIRPGQANDVEGYREFCAFTLPSMHKDLDNLLEIAEAVFAEKGFKTKPGPPDPSSLLMNEIDLFFANRALTKECFYDNIEGSLLKEEKGRSRQRGIYKFYCMLSYTLTLEENRSRGLDDILADLRALPNVTIVTVVIKNQKISEGRYIAGLSIKYIPSIPGQLRAPEDVKSRILRDIRRLQNVKSLFKVSAGLERLE